MSDKRSDRIRECSVMPCVVAIDRPNEPAILAAPEPTAPVGFRRDLLFVRGEYVSIPKWLLARHDITAGTKLVWMNIVDRLGENQVAWPSLKKIAKDVGMTRGGVRNALRQLCDAGLLREVGEHRAGGSMDYAVTYLGPSKNCTSTKNGRGVVQKMDYPPSTKCTSPSTKIGPELLYGTTESTTEGNYPRLAASPLAGFAGSTTVGFASSVTNGSHHVGEAFGPVAPGSSDVGTEGGASGTMVKAKRSKGKPARAGGSNLSAAQSPLTDVEKATLLANVGAMERYLLWGRDSLRVPDDQLEPQGTNWRRFNGTLGDPKSEDWDVPAFAGYFWYRVCLYREKRKMQLTLPQWPRLLGVIKNLLATMTKKDLHRHIGVTISHFEMIQYMCRTAGETFVLNETALSHGLIKSTAFNIGQWTDEVRGAKYDEMRKFYGME